MDDNCFYLYSSWIGSKIIVKEDGTNIFFNKEEDSIKIETLAKLNETWTSYQKEDSLIIKAEIINWDTTSFLGITDSVKTIGFQAYDENMDSLAHEVNEMTIAISKYHGFVRTLNFYLFPLIGEDVFVHPLKQYELAGLSQPDVGLDNLTWFDIHDYQIGYEIHILFESESSGQGVNSEETTKTIYKYIGRSDFEDSIQYTIHRKKHIYSYSTYEGEEYITNEYYDDTISKKIYPNAFFDALPESVNPESNLIDNYQRMFADPPYNESDGNVSKRDLSNLYAFFPIEGDCWGAQFSKNKIKRYLKGLGGPYYYYTSPGYWKSRDLVYYEKGDETWGNPLEINVGIDQINSKEARVKVIPNPASERISIRFKYPDALPAGFKLFNNQGRLVKTKNLQKKITELNILNLSKGIYIYQIINKKGFVKQGKLLVK